MPYAAAIPYIMLAVTAASAGVAAYSAIQQGQAAKQSANYNAQVANNNAQVERYNAQMQAQQAAYNAQVVAAQMAFEQDAANRRLAEIDRRGADIVKTGDNQRLVAAQNEDEARLKRDRAMAEFKNRVAGSGVQVTGSSEDVWKDLGAQGDREAARIRQNGIFQQNDINAAFAANRFDSWNTSANLTESMNAGNLEIWRLRSGASVNGYNSQIAINRNIASARLSSMEGNNAVTSSYYNAAGSILSGIGDSMQTGAAINQYPKIGATSPGGAYNPNAQVRKAYAA